MNFRNIENKKVKLTYKQNGYANTIHGIVSKVGKDYLLFIMLENEKEIPIKKNVIKNICFVKK